MKERQQIYDRLCAVLTNYEQTDNDNIDYIDVAETLYEMLVEIQNKWETVITAQEERSEKLT